MKKGFTLVELLGVIIILSLLITITGVAITKTVRDSKDKIGETQETNIKQALMLWSEDHYIDIINSRCRYFSAEELVGEIVNNDILYASVCGYRDSEVAISEPNATMEYNFVYRLIKNQIPIAGEECFYYSDYSDGVEITDYDLQSCQSKYGNSITIPSTINGKKVKKIGNQAFDQMGLEEVIIPNTVEGIGESAFSNNSLTSVVIPPSVRTIGTYSFDSNYIETLVILNGTTSIGNYAFVDNDLTEVFIPDSVTTIGVSAFDANNITTVYIGSGISTVGGTAFGGHDNQTTETYNEITSVVIDSSSSNVQVNQTAFSWASGYNNSNIRWLKDE